MATKYSVLCAACGFESVFVSNRAEIERLESLLAAAEQGQKIDNMNSAKFYDLWRAAEARADALERELEEKKR